MTNRNIDLPSQRAKLLMEIEHPLRRKFRSESHWKRNRIFWAFITISIVTILTLTYAWISHLVDYQAQQTAMVQKAYAAEAQPLCSQYLHDKKLAGTAAEETLKQICL